MLSDYAELGPAQKYDLEKQDLPESLRNKEESATTYRERLYYEFRMPVVLAALNDLKYSYVEVISPFLSRAMINQVTALPDSLRTDKYLYKKIVQSIGPKIGFAKYAAIAPLKSILRTPEVVSVMIKELQGQEQRALLSDELAECIISNLVVAEGEKDSKVNEFFGRLARYLSRSQNWRKREGRQKKLLTDYNILAFRAYIISKMNSMLLADSLACAEDRKNVTLL